MMQPPTTSNKARSRNSILIVEDDTFIGELLVLVLACETTYRPLLASNEEEALRMVEEVKPVLVLLDYHLAEVNGLEVYDHLQAREELATLPAIVMSGQLPRHELHQRHLIGIEKPFDLDDLLHMIEEVLTPQPAREGSRPQMDR